MYKFQNDVSVVVRSGDTGEIKNEWHGENAISDDVLCAYGTIFTTSIGNPGSPPFCFLLPDGPNWTSGEWAAEGGSGSTLPTTPPWRTNPWAPYCSTLNESAQAGDPQWKTPLTHNYPAYAAGGQHKLFFTWTNLPYNLQLKAIGLTGWQVPNISNYFYGVPAGGSYTPVAAQSTFVPQTLVLLPTSILVHGNYAGGTPDVLQVSYFLSIVGTS